MGTAEDPAAWFENLPPEILSIIADHLCNEDAKSLSLVCKTLREVSLPYIFHDVRFEFSQSGFTALRGLLLCDLPQYVVSFTYLIPELLHPGTQSLKFFQENVINPDDYMETSNDKPYCNHLAEMNIPYRLVYNTFRCICEEQSAIVESCEDSTVLSNAFRELPRLSELRLDFCQTLMKEDWVEFCMDRTVTDNTVLHHFQVLSFALEAGRDSGVFVRTIHLSGLELPYVSTLRENPRFHFLKLHFGDLLKCVSNLRLSGSGSSMKILACIDLDLQHLELCQITVLDSVFYEFMQNNASIDSIGCHQARLNTSYRESVELSPELYDNLLKLGSSTTCMSASSCLICLKDGWRLSKY
ncbi:unnamed protein product [Penicillium salamii]|nr:unnamed protein product [Penicillium salamii]CAG8355583.1 unnamed protein product [Penicillium salamii]